MTGAAGLACGSVMMMTTAAGAAAAAATVIATTRHVAIVIATVTWSCAVAGFVTTTKDLGRDRVSCLAPSALRPRSGGGAAASPKGEPV